MEYIDFLRDMVEYKLEIDEEECVLRVFKFDTKKFEFQTVNISVTHSPLFLILSGFAVM